MLPEAGAPVAVELFAGVGGFRLGLERADWTVAWSNQWEPGTRVQHASTCYRKHFASGEHVNRDIAEVVDAFRIGELKLPSHSLLTAGFPCQDYSVAKSASIASGIEGRKGVLWWDIHKLLSLLVERMEAPEYLLLENVDRLLKSPRDRRGRDFAIMIASLNDLGYEVEWRVINAADYGGAQRRRRVFIVGRRHPIASHPLVAIQQTGVFARAFATAETPPPLLTDRDFELPGRLEDLTQSFGVGIGATPFLNGGVARERAVWTRELRPAVEQPERTLRGVLVDAAYVPAEYIIPTEQVDLWKDLKGAKKRQRFHSSGTPYMYVEGSMAFPDSLEKPARTLTTGEGGTSPSRFKHVIEFEPERFRRLLPVELERLNGFPDGWTDIGISDGRRAFLMGNALVVELVERLGVVLREDLLALDTAPAQAV